MFICIRNKSSDAKQVKHLDRNIKSKNISIHGITVFGYQQRKPMISVQISDSQQPIEFELVNTLEKYFRRLSIEKMTSDIQRYQT